MARERQSGGRRRLGKQPPRHRFFLNPYPDVRFTVCPRCSGKTRLRKLPLVVHVEPLELVVLNKGCRFCPACDLLIAHQDELEALLAAVFSERKPEIIGNDYLVLGTVDRSVWRQRIRTPLVVQDALDQLQEFKQVMRFELAPRWIPAGARRTQERR